VVIKNLTYSDILYVHINPMTPFKTKQQYTGIPTLYVRKSERPSSGIRWRHI